MFRPDSVTCFPPRTGTGTRPARVILLALALLGLPAVTASAGDLEITVENVTGRDGHLRVALYRQGADFLAAGAEEAASFRVVSPGSMRFAFPGLPAGDYGVAVFHDANANGKLDSNLLGIPTEGTGFSNGASASFGPPSFADVAVTVPAEGAVSTRARLNY